MNRSLAIPHLDQFQVIDRHPFSKILYKHLVVIGSDLSMFYWTLLEHNNRLIFIERHPSHDNTTSWFWITGFANLYISRDAHWIWQPSDNPLYHIRFIHLLPNSSQAAAKGLQNGLTKKKKSRKDKDAPEADKESKETWKGRCGTDPGWRAWHPKHNHGSDVSWAWHRTWMFGC